MTNELLAPNGKPSNLNAEQYKLVRTPDFKKWFGDWEKDPDNASKVVDDNGEPMVVYHTTSKDFYVFSKKKSKEGFFFAPNKSRLSVYGKSKIDSYFLNIVNPSYEMFESDLKYLITKGYDGIMDYGHAKHLGNKNLYEIIAFEPNQIKLADGTNTKFDSSSDDIRFEQGGEIDLQIDERLKKIRNDKDFFPFEILNEKGEKIGKIELMYRSDLNGYQISNSNVIEKGKGIGKKAYLKLRKILGKPIISDSSRSEDAEYLWKSLERSNDANYDSEIGKYRIYKKGGITESGTPDYLKMFLGK